MSSLTHSTKIENIHTKTCNQIFWARGKPGYRGAATVTGKDALARCAPRFAEAEQRSKHLASQESADAPWIQQRHISEERSCAVPARNALCRIASLL